MATKFKILDPVQGLIDYTNDIKPYRSKIIEALIEYVGTESIEVSVFEDFDLTLDMLYEFDGNFICLLGGYGTPSFGDPAHILVLSPDASKTILEYPAIGPGFFIVLDDKTSLFTPDTNVDFNISSFIEDKIAGVVSTGSPSNNAFIVFGDKTSNYPAATEIEIVGSAFNDNTYTISNSVFVGGSPITSTVIVVNESIPTNNVEGFVRTVNAQNTGTFSVINTVYNSGLLIPHTTVFITGISLSIPTLIDDNQRFVSLINANQLTYDGILSYSKALKNQGGSPVSSYHATNEGLIVTNVVAVTPTSVSILGDFQSSNLFIGDELIIEDSSGNDGTYTIESITYEFGGSPVSDFVTTFGVTALPDTNIDGILKLNIPSNVFIINGSDYARFFVQGTRVNITSGSHIGIYVILNARYFNDNTYIRVHEALIPEGTGRRILSVGANYITVDGDVTSIYAGSPAQQFNIVTSEKNDGLYTTSAATYDSLSNTTRIEIVEPFDVTDNTGEIHEFTSGDISHFPQGFGGSIDVCELVPQALTISTITEDFNILLGHKFTIDGTDSLTNKLYIQDPYGYAYDIFTSGSPAALNSDTSIEIISSGINNGVYNITAIETVEGVNTTLTLAGSPVLENSGTFSGSPEINGGFLLYKQWWQYYVTDITGGDFLVAGDATADINATDKNIIQHIFTGDTYTVTNVVIEGANTRITVSVPIVTVAGSPPIDITAGSPTFDDWIISV